MHFKDLKLLILDVGFLQFPLNFDISDNCLTIIAVTPK